MNTKMSLRMALCLNINRINSFARFCLFGLCLVLGGNANAQVTDPTDIDGDGIENPCDNCPLDFNPNQEDVDLFDDFEDGILSVGDTDVTIVAQPNGAVEEMSGMLVIDTTHAENTEVRIETRQDVLYGNFDVRIDFNLIEYSSIPNSALTTGLFVKGLYDAWFNAFGIMRSRFSGDNGYQFYYRHVGNYAPFLFHAGHPDDSGVFRLTRVGSVISGYYLDGDRFVQVGSVDATTAPLQVGVSANNHTSGGRIVVAFDHLVVSDGIGDVCDPAQMIENLMLMVAEMSKVKISSNNLYALLETTLNALDDANQNNDRSASHAIDLFIQLLEKQAGRWFDSADRELLIQEARRIQNRIGES